MSAALLADNVINILAASKRRPVKPGSHLSQTIGDSYCWCLLVRKILCISGIIVFIIDYRQYIADALRQV